MKTTLAIVATVMLVGCSQEPAQRLPTAPDAAGSPASPGGGLTYVWAMAVDESGACIVGATIEVVRGPSLGETITQRTPCSVWDYDGGAFFRGVTPGVEMTLRASASGFAAHEKTFVISPAPQQAVVLTPARIR